MKNDFNSKYLEHHGILGMKWGRRNGPPYPLDASQKSAAEKKHKSSRSSSGEIKKKLSTAKNVLKSDSGSKGSKAYREARKKDIDSLSTQELKEINNRLNEEKRYQDLTRGNISDGKRFVKEMSKNVVSGIVVGISIEVGKKYVKKKLGVG